MPYPDVDSYYESQKKFEKSLSSLRKYLLSTELEEAYKWSAPVYTVDGKNVLAVMAFKSHFGIWFYQGVFLSDPYKLLSTAQEKTKAMRHIKYQSDSDMNIEQLKVYIEEAIANEKSGKRVKVIKRKLMPEKLMLIFLDESPQLKKQYEGLSQAKKNEYIEYISEAKKEETKMRRLQKIKPMILQGKGLNDKYKSK